MSKASERPGRTNQTMSPRELDLHEDEARQTSVPRSENTLQFEGGSISHPGSPSGRGTPSQPDDERFTSSTEAQNGAESEQNYHYANFRPNGNEARETPPRQHGPDPGNAGTRSQRQRLPYLMEQFLNQDPKNDHWSNNSAAFNQHGDQSSAVNRPRTTDTERSRSQHTPSTTGAMSGGASTRSVNQHHHGRSRGY